MKLDTTRAPGFHSTVELRHFIMEVMRFELRSAGKDEYRLDLVCVVPSRDTGEPFKLHWARFIDARTSESDVVREIYGEVRNMLLHELAEAWHVDSARTEDPHA